MKKAGLFAGCFCLTALCASIVAQQRKEGMPNIQATFEAAMKNRDAAKERLNTLFTAGLYDSVIYTCSTAPTNTILGYEDIEQVLATAYWYKGDKTTAYQYVQKSADYSLKLNGGGGNPFGMLEDYSYGPALATDTFLVQMITGKVSDYYRAMEYYPDRGTGLKLMLMDYKAQKLINKHRYDLKQTTSKDEKQVLNTRYEQEKEVIDNELVTLLKENRKVFSRHDVGPADEKQFGLITNFHKQEQLSVVIPLLHQAMLDKEIDPDRYVNALIAVEQLKDNTKSRRSLQDSLCRIYKCKMSVTDSVGNIFSYAIGDTIFRRGDTAYIQDNQGRPMKVPVTKGNGLQKDK